MFNLSTLQQSIEFPMRCCYSFLIAPLQELMVGPVMMAICDHLAPGKGGNGVFLVF